MGKWFKKYKYVASLTGFIIIVFLSYVPFIIVESLKDNSTILFSLSAILSLAISSILLLLYHQYFYKRTAKEFSGVLRYLLIGEVGGLIGLIGFLSEFVLSSLLAEYIKNMIANENLIKNAGLAITTFLNMFSVGFVFVYFFDKQLQIRPSKGREPKPVLIFALSKPRNDKGKCKEIISELPNNYIPICELLEFHKNVLKEIHVLCSPEIKKDGLEYLGEILKNLGMGYKIADNNRIHEYNFDNERSVIIYPYECNFDNEESIKEQINKINIEIKKYEDKDISIYISSGTSLVTAILTLLGLERDRQIEYITQGKSPSEIKAIEISKDDALLFLKTLALK
ncbi:MAG: hypothetical protein JHC31_12685 [Sulfurihydrogenibium sp.]|jgi:hypothetical protein|nr:hypothetical protein [Sulfurihydrogenibium sp.]